MIQIKRTNSDNKDFLELVKLLDADLAIRDGEDHAFYAQFNKIDHIKYVVVAYLDKEPVACGAIKEFEPRVMEIKRMFVLEEHRGKGIAKMILKELENWTRELGSEKCVLETGIKQPEAIGLYKKCNYHLIPNYGQYKGVDASVCFAKIIKKQ